jgi:hypothetical protein
MKTPHIALTLAAALAAVSAAQAQSITYDFTNLSTAATISGLSGVTASALINGSGSGNAYPEFDVLYTPNNASLPAALFSGDPDGALQFATNINGNSPSVGTPQYFHFTVSNGGANPLSLGNLSFNAASSGDTGVRKIDVYYRIDSGALTLLGSSGDMSTSVAFTSLDLSTVSIAASSTIEFRFFGDSQSTSLGRDLAIDDINLTATAIPEPSAFAALAGLGALGLVVARRRRR